jgi:ATP-binding cassette subfamily B protein
LPPARPPTRPAPEATDLASRIRSAAGVFAQVPGTFRLVREADPLGGGAIAALSLVLALFPAALAWVGKLIVDAIVAATRSGSAGDRRQVALLVLVELALMAASLLATRLLGLLRELLRTHLGNRVNEAILEKALTLELRHFEDSRVYDKMQNARREASSRPLSLVMQVFGIGQNAVTLVALSALLWRLSPWSVLVIAAASIPAFVAEARLSAESFRVNIHSR